ncbi:MAG: hypothetical protein GEV08_24155 [Acidimicrobiia bacterium]|nr:hypothetical protein [Acidimicrobiia bacterium]
MAATSKPRTTRARTTKKAAVVAPENRTPSEVVADEILGAFRDLSPSVQRIMEADVSEAGRLHAIGLFRESLGVDGDPNRNPAVAIEAGRAMDASSNS